MESKEAFIEDYQRQQLSVSELCRRHQISRTCAYKWLNRYAAGGSAGLQEQSRRPRHSPRASPNWLEEAVLAIRREHPCWGGRKIRKVLERDGCPRLPAASTISNILRRHGLLGTGMRDGATATAYQRFERPEPNDLWQMDFKGWLRLANGQRCYPLAILDDHSRYNVLLQACPGERQQDVRPALVASFRRYGLPRQILCDHGNPWGKGPGADGQQRGTPQMEVWLARLGVELIHGRVRHPQTQGKQERFNRTLNVEVIQREQPWKDLEHCQRAFNHWQHTYNEVRPHEALQMGTPSQHYRLSRRSYPEQLAPETSFYLAEDIIKKVKSKGEITYRNHNFYIGRAYIGAPVALRSRGADVWDVYYCWKRLGTIDFNQTYKPKGSYNSIQTNTVSDVRAHL